MDTATYSAFSGTTLLITGPLESVLRELKRTQDTPAETPAQVLVFNDQQGQQVDFDLRGPIEEILRKAIPAPPKAGPGRPKLGVVSREVTLLPRQWEWLESQPNGASAALRRLIEEARKSSNPDQSNSNQPQSDQPIRARIEAVGRVMTVLAGNLPNFEEALRALYRRDLPTLTQQIEAWPPDIRTYILKHAS